MTLKPSAQGSLTKTPLPHLLVYTAGQKLTGTLAIWPDSDQEQAGQDRLFFEDGLVTSIRPLRPAPNALEALLRLFQRRDGAYAFYEQQNLLGSGAGVLSEPVDLYALLSRGLRQAPREDVMDATLARFGGRVLRMRPGVPLERLEFEAKELALVDSLRAGPSTVEELLSGSELPSLAAKRVLYLLGLVRGIEVSEEGELPRATVAGRSNSGFVPRVTVGTSQPPARAATPTPGSHAPVAPAAAGASNLPPTPPVPPGLSATDLARWNELVALYKRLDDVNHFDLLGLPLSTPAPEVGTAYFALVKKFHPDRLPPALAPLASCAQLVFDRITEANETLGNPTTRADYMKAVEGGGGTRSAERLMRNVLESAVEFQKAEVLIKRRDYAQALTLIRSAMAKNPDEADCNALYGWVLHLMNPGESGPFDEMLRAFDRALSAHPKNERAHYYKGVVLKRVNRGEEATKHFQKAVEINPRNVEAAREVRLAEMRKDSKPPQQNTGKLLSKLFGNTKGD
ncbi:MAG: tetratricopeptide repeat protein [Myxococcales bacterium]